MLSVVWSDGALVVEDESHRKLPHRHHAVQLSIALDAVCWASVDGAPHELPCRAMLIAPNRLHTLRGRVLSLLLEPHSQVGSRLWAAIGARGFLPVEHPALDQYVSQVLQVSSAQGRVASAELCREATVELSTALSRTLQRRTDVWLEDRVAEVRAQLAKRAGMRVSLPELAAHARLSPGRLRHLFAEQMGLPIRSYVLWLRTLVGLSSLVGGQRVGTVAHRVGFADHAAFARAYRDAWGITPSAFNRLVQLPDPSQVASIASRGGWLG